MIPKFRAWDKRENTMRDVAVLHFTKGGKVNSIEYWKTPYELKSYHVRNLVLMQSTCLKDKNGMEIFEGDVVAFEDSDGGYEYQDIVINTGIVEYGELGFYFTNRVAVDMDDFYIKDGRCDDVEVIGNIYENPEVIGNIYENSELLSYGTE